MESQSERFNMMGVGMGGRGGSTSVKAPLVQVLDREAAFPEDLAFEQWADSLLHVRASSFRPLAINPRNWYN